METFFSYVSVGMIANVAIFVATLVFADKIKDFFKGVPAHTRATLKQVEQGLVAKVTEYEQDLVGKLLPPTKAPVTATVTTAAILPEVVKVPAPAAPAA